MNRRQGSKPGFLPLLRVPVMSLKMVWANFTSPSLHLLEQPLMMAEGKQAPLPAPGREGFPLACPWNVEPASANPERWTHPRRSRNSTAAAAVGLASASRVAAGHDVRSCPPSFPPPLPAVHSSPTHRRTSGCQGWDGSARAQGAPRQPRTRGTWSRAGREELELAQASLSFVHGTSGNVAINTPVGGVGWLR